MIIRHNPYTQNDFLRWMVGVEEVCEVPPFKRDPKDSDDKLEKIKPQVFFRLIGFGSTEANAKIMAGVA